LLLVLAWAYWTTLGEFHERWANNAQYSHGYLVPLFAGALLWMRRGQARFAEWRSSWLAVPVVLAAAGLCLFGGFYFYPAAYQLSLLPMLAGVVLALGGLPALRWAAPSIAFLVFMMPLPGRVEGFLSAPLQRTATVSSTYLLQTVGIPAVADGNVILLDQVELGVVEQCSGLRMLMVFFALTVGMAIVIEGGWWLRVLLVVSTVPVALASNITRITLTGILHETVGQRVADAIYHDWTGWLMILLGLAMLLAELSVLSRLVVVREDRDLLPERRILE
jgi:exosortase